MNSIEPSIFPTSMYQSNICPLSYDVADLPFASEALPKQWALQASVPLSASNYVDVPIHPIIPLQHPMDWLNAASRSIAALDIPGHQHEARTHTILHTSPSHSDP